MLLVKISLSTLLNNTALCDLSYRVCCGRILPGNRDSVKRLAKIKSLRVSWHRKTSYGQAITPRRLQEEGAEHLSQRPKTIRVLGNGGTGCRGLTTRLLEIGSKYGKSSAQQIYCNNLGVESSATQIYSGIIPG